jgi:hypothetical protein
VITARVFFLVLVLGVGLAAPVFAQDETEDLSGWDLLDTLDCAGVTGYCQEVVLSLFVEGQPDSLLDLIFYWEETCGRAEPITRALILGSIWDGAFSEDLYDDEIIDFLIWYRDPARSRFPQGEVDSDQASGGVASEADFVEGRDRFDAFTVDLADQLLPHVATDSLEEFFCLFYSGRHQAAWKLLAGNALRDTYLKRVYEWELERISLERSPANLFFTAGYWMPSGNLAWAGDHPVVGVMMEQQGKPVFWRLSADLLIGRSKNVYTVDQPEFSGRSDRFNVFSLVTEGGFSLLKRGSYRLNVFAGGGVDFLIPFMDVGDDQSATLYNLKGVVGAGYRINMGPFRKWMAGLDLRREWAPDRNSGGTPMDGQAWSVRLSFAYNRNHDLDRRLRGLGR